VTTPTRSSTPPTGSSTAPATGRPAARPRSRSPWRAVFFGLAALGIVAGVAWALTGSRLLVVRSVAVVGTHLVPQAEVIGAAAIPPGIPMIRVDGAAVVRRVEAIRQVESAQVSKDWPNRVVITVQERTPDVAVPVPGTGGYDLVDRFGVIVQWSGSRPGRMPLYLTSVAPAALGRDPDVRMAAAVLRELPPQLRRSVLGLSAPSTESVTLHLTGGVTVVWGDTSRATAKTTELAILVRSHARFYDVSAPGTAVTK
jgi:cell division protein FtsQ